MRENAIVQKYVWLSNIGMFANYEIKPLTVKVIGARKSGAKLRTGGAAVRGQALEEAREVVVQGERL